MLLRETLCADGAWRRFDSFNGAVCEVGMDEAITIDPRHFFRIHRQLDSSKGKRAKVRFREYTMDSALPCITNVGEAVVDPDEVRQCRFDLLFARSGSFEDLVASFLGKDSIASLPYRGDALLRLSSFTDEPRRVPALKEILQKAKAADDLDTYFFALRGLQNEGPKWTQDHY